MKTKSVLFFTNVLMIALMLQACGLPSLGGAQATAAPTEAAVVPTEPPAQPAIVHSVIPNAGSTQVSNAHDNEESTTFEEKSVRGGDDFRNNRFERPFTSGEMVYQPYIDIVDAAQTKDDIFYYIQIKLAGVDPSTNGANGYYGVEFDLDIDGRTEVLVLAHVTNNSSWTTDGVKVFSDQNGDIGGLSSKPDDAYTGNGYETVIFDAGNGFDADLAWVRFVNSSSPIVEIALKQDVLEGNKKYMFSVLASANEPDPSKMYFNDVYTEERAGSPIKGNEFYPLNELASFDNTCRLPSGFQPSGSEAYGCQVAGPEAENVPSSSSSGGIVWIPDFNICNFVIWC